MKKERFKAIPASYLILLRNQNKEILLLQRANSGYMDGMYSVVAGHVEEEEMPMPAMIREAKEEAGIKLTQENLKIGHMMYRITPYDSRFDMFFVASQWQGEVTNKEPDKCTDLSWFPIDKLPENTIPYIQHAIESYMQGIIYSEFREE